MIEHLRIVALATAFLVGLSALQDASLASPKPHVPAGFAVPGAPAQTMPPAQARIMAGAAFKSISAGG